MVLTENLTEVDEDTAQSTTSVHGAPPVVGNGLLKAKCTLVPRACEFIDIRAANIYLFRRRKRQ
jgi:hypothetical protein